VFHDKLQTVHRHADEEQQDDETDEGPEFLLCVINAFTLHLLFVLLIDAIFDFLGVLAMVNLVEYLVRRRIFLFPGFLGPGWLRGRFAWFGWNGLFPGRATGCSAVRFDGGLSGHANLLATFGTG